MHFAWITIVSVAFIVVTCDAGWTKDWGYEGAYPGGCVHTSECPPDERCMHIEDEVECPKDHKNMCRCTLGCQEGPYVLRFQQWRPIPGKGVCMCESPKKNLAKCKRSTEF